MWLTSTENGFTPDISKVERLKDTLKKRISRISKLAITSNPQCDKTVNGLFIVECKDLKKIYVSRKVIYFGQRRMKDDHSAPSRSYLKIEEAFSIFNHSPGNCESVVDLGAAPGGWTWAALKRGATVYAIDNGPLKNGPLNHPNVHHFRQDAYAWQPDTPVDWLFCDMVDQPTKVFELIYKWFSNRWCRFAIVNFKYGYSDPVKIIDLLYSRKGLLPFSKKMICRHLYHDRDEITIMVEIH